MTSGNINWTRRKFILISAAGVVAAPVLAKLPDLALETKAAEEVKTTRQKNPVYDNPKCKGCQMCTIFYSNCLTLNNRVCWCEPVRDKTA